MINIYKYMQAKNKYVKVEMKNCSKEVNMYTKPTIFTRNSFNSFED